MLLLLVYVNCWLVKFVGVELCDVVFILNVIVGINIVIRFIEWCLGDIVYYLNICYYIVKKLFRYFSSVYGKWI